MIWMKLDNERNKCSHTTAHDAKGVLSLSDCGVKNVIFALKS